MSEYQIGVLWGMIYITITRMLLDVLILICEKLWPKDE